MAASQSKRYAKKKQLTRRLKRRTKSKTRKQRPRKRRPALFRPDPGDLALRERTLPGRRFVEFPLVKGKVAEKVQLFTTSDANVLTIEFQDHTYLDLDIEPKLTIHAELMRMERGDPETLAEWPPIQSAGYR